MEKSAKEQIDDIIKKSDNWRGDMLARLRDVILDADSGIVEEVKWKMPSNPSGVPVWTKDGIICIANVLKSSLRLSFQKGAKLSDPDNLFNARLNSSVVRAIDYFEGVDIDADGLRRLVQQAIRLNGDK